MINKIVAANEAIDAIVADKADELDKLDETDEAGIAGEADVANLLLPFSLTKCSAFFSEDKVYFGIRFNVCNNKLLVARSRDELDKLVESKDANNSSLELGIELTINLDFWLKMFEVSKDALSLKANSHSNDERSQPILASTERQMYLIC